MLEDFDGSPDGSSPKGGFLHGIRVLELADEGGEYCGKLLAGLGADVVKLEALTGEATRGIGPFYRDEVSPDTSLHFWHYNVGKRSVTYDPATPEGRALLARLLDAADVVLDARVDPRPGAETLDDVRAGRPRLIHARITPFGDDGPWSAFRAGDLVHLALGGVAMNCGYDPDPSGKYDTPPVAPQMWQAYHLAGEMTAMSIIVALDARLRSGEGQYLASSIHDAISKSTEMDVPDWTFLHRTLNRLTARHVADYISLPALAQTKDGRYLLPYRSYLSSDPISWDQVVTFLQQYDFAADLADPRYDKAARDLPESQAKISVQIDSLVKRTLFKDDLWVGAQELAMAWAPVRRPEENIADEHWRIRGSITEIEHPELGASFAYVGSRWVCDEVPWSNLHRAPLLGEHTDEVLRDWVAPAPVPAQAAVSPRVAEAPAVSTHGKPFALSHIRVVDLGWMLASAGATRFLSAFGAEVIKVEHESRQDWYRISHGQCPPGGREERDAATSTLPIPVPHPNRSGNFMDVNAGKLGLSLNIKSPEGRAALEDLIREADVVTEGFSAGVMDRMGLGYDKLKELNPNIIYVAQSGFGQRGLYGGMRSYGPPAAAMTGLTDMSGLASPYPPAGIGYSFLDWFGAYNMATAIMAAVYRRDVTGEGCYIDASQCEVGIYLTGTAILDSSANGREWSRYGNRSPYKPAAPHGIYPAADTDRWVAISAFTDEQWTALTEVLAWDAARSDPRFATRDARLRHQDALDAEIAARTAGWERYELMTALQAAGVPAGVCQTAEDRIDNDPQLEHLQWRVELDQSTIGRWPMREHPVKLSGTPSYMGGRFDKAGPTYGEDTDFVLRTYLGLRDDEIEQMRAAGAL